MSDREPEPDVDRLARFDHVERAVHWSTAALFAVAAATAAALYVGPLSTLVGRRDLVRDVHVVAGLALPVPFLVAVVGRRWGAALRRDVGEVNRWFAHDWQWLRSLGRDPFVRVGKFNAGQKLNATFTAAAIVLLVATGSVMRWFEPFPLDWRTGATFVHDWLALLLAVTITGHVVMGLSDRHALRGIVTGSVPRDWAESHHGRWADEAAPEPVDLQRVREQLRRGGGGGGGGGGG